ncbi:MAG: alpha/beta fold hydrolase [Solirubrobacteraceae bacterium]
MSPVIEGAGVELHYAERGSGDAVLLVHETADAGRGWVPVLERLATRARVIAYDRRGYGGSGAPQVYERTSVNEQGEDAAALLRGLGAEPAVVVGAGFGALVVLDLLVRHSSLVRAAVLITPALYSLVPEANEPLAEERAALEEALREGGPPEAVSAWLSTHAPDASAERVEAARGAHAAFFADVGGSSTWPVSRRELRAVARPVTILDGNHPAPHDLAAIEALAALLPKVERREGADVVGAVEALLT